MTLFEFGIASVFVILAVLGSLLVIAGLPGVWLLALTALVVEAIWPQTLGVWVVAGAIATGVVGEVLEFAAGAAGAKAAGGSKSAAFAAILGALVGAILGTLFLPFLPIIGTIVGAVAGAGLSAGLVERGVHGKKWGDSARVAQGAATGRLLAIALKGGLAFVLGIALAIAAIAR